MLQPGFIEDVKACLRVLFMFLPLPVFWALFDQQVSHLKKTNINWSFII